MRHVITATVENRSGVLAHISALFSARGFNIDSLTVGRTEDPTVSRMTIVAQGDDQILEQIIKQLRKIIDVIKVQDLSDTQYVERDLMLLKVNVPPGKRGEIIEVVDIFRGKVIDVTPRDLVIELSGNEDKLEAMVSLMQQYGIKEMCRTGSLAMLRGTMSRGSEPSRS
jgi:acetolactate synthase-1/3 small subunit